MTFEEVHQMWMKDSDIDDSNLGIESTRSHKLHATYYRLFHNESLKLKKLKKRYDILYLEKYEFYTQGPTKEDIEKGWKLPAKGVILKNEVDKYLAADPDIINLSLKIAVQDELVTFIESVIYQINQRQWTIKNRIDWQKFLNGEN